MPYGKVPTPEAFKPPKGKKKRKRVMMHEPPVPVSPRQRVAAQLREAEPTKRQKARPTTPTRRTREQAAAVAARKAARGY
jgi:hypothetical protein